jgi:hypothetical protein
MSSNRRKPIANNPNELTIENSVLLLIDHRSVRVSVTEATSLKSSRVSPAESPVLSTSSKG